MLHTNKHGILRWTNGTAIGALDTRSRVVVGHRHSQSGHTATSLILFDTMTMQYEVVQTHKITWANTYKTWEALTDVLWSILCDKGAVAYDKGAPVSHRVGDGRKNALYLYEAGHSATLYPRFKYYFDEKIDNLTGLLKAIDMECRNPNTLIADIDSRCGVRLDRDFDF